jgi:sugar phosphate isomerase/epimerase
MKYAFMSFSTPRLSLSQMLDLARRYGYDGIEPRAGSGHGHGVELTTSAAQRRALGDQSRQSGVALACLAVGCKYADPQMVGANVDETKRYIDLAADIGSSRVRVFGGALPAGFDREAAIAQVATSLRTLADHAAERDITLCLETHDDWCNPDHVAQVMRRVDHPAVGVNWDFWHPVRTAGKGVRESFDTLRPWIRHVHFHDGMCVPGKLDQRAIGQGNLDVGLAVRLLKSMPYDGYLSGEWINWEPYETHLPRELAAVKSLEKEAG